MSEEKKNVLLVDDDVDILDQLKFQLEANGYNVIAGESQKEGEELIEENEFDIAILDLMMEHTDSGFNLAYRIKKKNSDIPVILLTAVTSETGMQFETSTKGEKSWMKADVLINKPVRIEQLKREMDRLLKG
jgi:two-component system alkaline phosphatase synthesis response regulator PhoP